MQKIELTFSYDRRKVLMLDNYKHKRFLMNPSTTRIILEKIQELGEVTLNSFFPKKYSRTHLARKLFGLDRSPTISRETLSSMLSRLKREGIIARSHQNGKSIWHITSKGKKWMNTFYKPVTEVLPSDGIERIVIFDIPEKERKKRDMIREELNSYGFKQLQKSVWMGDHPLPKEFILLLDELQLKNKVHLFVIEKRGTLTNNIY